MAEQTDPLLALRHHLQNEQADILAQMAKGVARREYWKLVGRNIQLRRSIEELQNIIRKTNGGDENEGD